MRNVSFVVSRIQLIVGLVFVVSITTISCDEKRTLEPLFSSFYKEKIPENELITSHDIKERIIQQYSQMFYDKILGMNNFNSTLQYDSVLENLLL